MPSANLPCSVLPKPPAGNSAAEWALLLDIDGTLLDFKADPRAVVADLALRDLLAKLGSALGGALAMVSGRSIEDLDRIFGASARPAAGIHGLELRHAKQPMRQKRVNQSALLHMRDVAREVMRRFPDIELEDKKYALALHTRGTESQVRSAYAAATELLCGATDVEIQPGRQVLELKPTGMSKGTAVVELMSEPPFVGRKPVYVGDDLTDEFAFARVNEMAGISVRVGHRTPTAANFGLDDVAATHKWLRQLLLAISHGANTE